MKRYSLKFIPKYAISCWDFQSEGFNLLGNFLCNNSMYIVQLINKNG